MIPHNSLFKRQLNHYQLLLDDKEQLRAYYEGEKVKAEASSNWANVKLCIRMLSQVKAEEIQVRDAIYYWKKEEEEYFKVK
jgi:hypothetical protein